MLFVALFYLEQVPYIESGDYVAYNNENGGVMESLKKDGFADLDTEFYSDPEWVSTKAMVSSWLGDALMYELWVGSDSSSAQNIYYPDLPWPIGKVLFLKQFHTVKLRLGITKDNAEQKEEEVLIFPLIFLVSALMCSFSLKHAHIQHTQTHKCGKLYMHYY